MSKRIPKTTGEFGATMGIKVRLTTLLVVVVEVFIMAPVIWFVAMDDAPVSARALVTSVLVLIPIITSLFVIRGYELRSDGLYVSRLIWRNHLPLENLVSAEYKPNASCRAFKLLGNGGLFAIHGKFRNKELGTFQAFITDPKNDVVLKFPKHTIVVSPDDPERFVRYLGIGKTEGLT